jgi:hypothetical protein
MTGAKQNAYEFFRNSPLYGCDLDLERDKTKDRNKNRDIDFSDIDFGDNDL